MVVPNYYDEYKSCFNCDLEATPSMHQPCEECQRCFLKHWRPKRVVKT
jgi:hypothetical protein